MSFILAFVSAFHLWITGPLIWQRRERLRDRPVLWLVPLLAAAAIYGAVALQPELPMTMYPFVAAAAMWHWGRQNIGLWLRWRPMEQKERIAANCAFVVGLALFGRVAGWWELTQLQLTVYLALSFGLASYGWGSAAVTAFYWLLILPGDWGVLTAPILHAASYLIATGLYVRWAGLLALPAAFAGAMWMTPGPAGLWGATLVAVNVVHYWFDSFLWKRSRRIATGTG